MKVKEYLSITVAKKLQFLTVAGRLEKINAVNGKWGEYSYPPEIRKWLDSEIIKVFVMSDGSVRIHTKPNYRKIIYMYSDLGYHNGFAETEGGKLKSISQYEILSFLSEAKEKDIPILIDGKVNYLSAVK